MRTLNSRIYHDKSNTPLKKPTTPTGIGIKFVDNYWDTIKDFQKNNFT